MEKKFGEIKELLLMKGDEAVIPKIVKDKPLTNIWDDKEKLVAAKAPLPKSVLVIKRAEEEDRNVQNHNFIENTLMNHNIPVTKSFKSKSGDLLVVCESKDARDQIKDLVSTTNQDIKFATPQEMRSSISIVGLSKEYNKDEVFHILPMQFTVSNKIEDHVTIYAIRPLKNNPSRFQIFASVSPAFR